MAAVLLVLFAAPLASTACECSHDAPCSAASLDGAADCHDTKDGIPCECPACKCQRTTPVAVSVDTCEQRLAQDNLPIAWLNSTELPLASRLADASPNARPPATALQRSVLFSRLTLLFCVRAVRKS